MNKEYILYNLKEAFGELNSIIQEIENDATYEYGDFVIPMQHLYHHLNTAWNSRDSTKDESVECTEVNFEKWRQFPTDIYLGL